MKNNNILLLAFFSVLTAALVSCNSSEKQIEVQKEIYTKAIGADDYSTALVAAYQIAALEDQSSFMDSIAAIYHAVGNSYGAYKIAEEALAYSNSKELKAIYAQSQKSLRKYSEAINTFKELITEDPENVLEYEYSMGECYFFLEDFQNCLDYMKKVTDREQSKTKMREMVFNQRRQNISYQLLALNTVAYTLTINGSIDQGIEIYEQILKARPDFALALNNYQYALQLKEEQGKKK